MAHIVGGTNVSSAIYGTRTTNEEKKQMVMEVRWKSRHTFENKKVGAKDRRTKGREQNAELRRSFSLHQKTKDRAGGSSTRKEGVDYEENMRSSMWILTMWRSGQ